MVFIEKGNTDIPVWERYTLTIEEASRYFRIGENKLRNWQKNINMQAGSFGTATVFRLSENSLKILLINWTLSDENVHVRKKKK